MLSITVKTNPSYQVDVSNADLADSMQPLAGLLGGQKVAIITDGNVARHYGACLDACLKDKTVCKIVVPAGEVGKCPAEYMRILNTMAAAHFSRADTVIALGGGVVGDLAGFAASTYMRGVDFINIPTSLLAMVDSAIGGKTAINIDYGKNLCGTFYQPKWVCVNTAFLDTLPQAEHMCGWGEIIKYAFLSDTITLQDLRGDVTPQLIAKCVQIKADIVAADEREGGLRKLLNLGHTIGHAVERLSDFHLSHGACVAKGLQAALQISRSYFSLSDEQYAAAEAIVAAKGHDLSIPYTAEQIMQQILSDKKSNALGTDMVLINGDMRAEIVFMPYDDIRKLL